VCRYAPGKRFIDKMGWDELLLEAEVPLQSLITQQVIRLLLVGNEKR
jgi:hypothetical protein